MTGTDLLDRVDGLLHEDTQVHEYGVDLTAADVARVATPGRIDFGGGELEPAALEPVETTRRDPDDDYAWWHLDGGTYVVTYNEELTEGAPLRVQPRRELRERGAFHPSLRVTELDRMPLTVPTGGVRIKENARVTTLLDTTP